MQTAWCFQHIAELLLKHATVGHVGVAPSVTRRVGQIALIRSDVLLPLSLFYKDVLGTHWCRPDSPCLFGVAEWQLTNAT